jgi:CubicO group peptidase (beta-lactamase class C family)
MACSSSTVAAAVREAVENAVDRGVTPGGTWGWTTQGAEPQLGATGHLASHDGEGRPVPVDQRRPVDDGTVYDLASVTKVFTAVTVLSLADSGLVDLDVPIGTWLPAYRTEGKRTATLAHLLSHTSGLPAEWPGWRRSVDVDAEGNPHWRGRDRTEVLGAILDVPLVRPVGSDFEYSCLGYITAMAVAERATGAAWDELVLEQVLGPLGLRDTTFRPEHSRTAPTEHQPELGRGLVHAVVHDETACSLGGVSGNAGLFAPVGDVLRFGEAIAAGLPGVLGPEAFGRLWHDQLSGLLGDEAAELVRRREGFGHSLGLRIGQVGWTGSGSEQARGHTGFTGTCLVVDRSRAATVALLTNRVHPRRDGPDLTPTRVAVAEAVLAGQPLSRPPASAATAAPRTRPSR